MLPVAFASSLWTATLRRIARTAVTALAVIAGVTGPAAVPAADHVHPTASARPAVGLRVDVPAAVPVDVAPVVRRAAAASGLRTAADSPARHAFAAPAPAGPPHRAVADVAIPAGTVVVAASDPGRAAIARRGPPRA
ncbi:hypothetical protein GCE86_28375 [Micromonospora terminaliae]|uniref:Uncharacterized protein n=1 Tax=Micromonospora terminaliae TaxID=1914461 RepID=A0AAJ3DJZ5_9ACTN|nr:hypothetical protein [Micromonospora terminaliae]NES26420.1 hypothetical protein [Micromonospora terminaliae]QGL50598.1 hypothetical protein GCE86_28375 [Micromonospora terminaliae]